MLEANRISYRYNKNKWLFRHVTIQIQPGRIIGLYGLSGAGKSTMAKVLSGYLSPNEGEVKVDGTSYPIKGKHPVQLVWQHPEQAINPRWRMKKVLEETGEIPTDLLNAFSIKEDWLHRYPSELSGGELQRFCLARAFHSNTKYVIADEITTMLDSITQAQIWQGILKVVDDRSIGVLAISHNEALLQKVCDEIIHFDQL